MKRKVVKKVLIFVVILMVIAMSRFGVVTNIATGAKEVHSNSSEGASGSYNIALNAGNTTLKPGETLTMNLTIQNINITSGDKGIGSYQGSIVYDKNIFENLTIKNASSEWDSVSENEGNFLSIRSDGTCSSANQTVATITLKAKSTAAAGSYNVKVTNFKASDGVNTIPTTDASLSASVVSASSPTNNTSNTSNTATNTSNNSNTSNTANNNSNKNTSTTNGSTTSSTATTTQNRNSTIVASTNVTSANTLPKTGTSRTIIYVIAGVAIVGFIFYEKYKYLNI